MNLILYAGALLRWASAHRDQLQQLIACLHQDWTQVEELLADFPPPPASSNLAEVFHSLPALAAGFEAAAESCEVQSAGEFPAGEDSGRSSQIHPLDDLETLPMSEFHASLSALPVALIVWIATTLVPALGAALQTLEAAVTATGATLGQKLTAVGTFIATIGPVFDSLPASDATANIAHAEAVTSLADAVTAHKLGDGTILQTIITAIQQGGGLANIIAGILKVLGPIIGTAA